MKSYIVRRTGNQHYTEMMRIYKWCVNTFGPPEYNSTNWKCDFYEDSDNFVEFSFYDESMATQFVLVHRDKTCTEGDVKEYDAIYH